MIRLAKEGVCTSIAVRKTSQKKKKLFEISSKKQKDHSRNRDLPASASQAFLVSLKRL